MADDKQQIAINLQTKIAQNKEQIQFLGKVKHAALTVMEEDERDGAESARLDSIEKEIDTI